MRIEVHVHGDLYIGMGVTCTQLEAALRPWLDYLDVDSIEEAKSLEPDEPGIVYDKQNRVLQICWTGQVGRNFEQCLEECLRAVGPYTEQAVEVSFTLYHENGEDETRVIFVGPNLESIHDAQRQRMAEDISMLLSRQFEQDAVDEVIALVNDLFRRDWEKQKSQTRWEEQIASEASDTTRRRRLH